MSYRPRRAAEPPPDPYGDDEQTRIIPRTELEALAPALPGVGRLVSPGPSGPGAPRVGAGPPSDGGLSQDELDERDRRNLCLLYTSDAADD